MRVTEFIFVRHTAVDVPEGTCYGQSDVPLRDSFAQEAAQVCRQLHEMANEQPFSRVYTSPLSRCTRLAQACGYAHAHPDRRILELNFGSWEGVRWDEIDDPNLPLWYADWQHRPTPNGESSIDQYNRVDAFLKAVATQTNGRILLFTHGGVIACAQSLLGDLSLEQALANTPPYGSITRLLVP